MDDSQKKPAKNTPPPGTPVIGTSLSNQDLSRLTRHLTYYKQQEIKELLKFAPTKVSNEWYMREMGSDVQVVQLETLIDDAIAPLGDDSYLASESLDEADDPFDVHYEVLMNDEEPPVEIKQFLLSLEKLVRRTQHQLKKYRKTDK